MKSNYFSKQCIRYTHSCYIAERNLNKEQNTVSFYCSKLLYECKYCCIREFLRSFNPNKRPIIGNSYAPFQKEDSRNKTKSYKIHQNNYLSTTYYQFDLKLIKINKI